ncbi:hypothetical protein ABIA65_006053 [Mycolicibacterium sp. 624]
MSVPYCGIHFRRQEAGTSTVVEIFKTEHVILSTRTFDAGTGGPHAAKRSHPVGPQR